MIEIVNIAIAVALGYLLGSIPFGLILTQMAGMGDIRKVGSGNIGATNVLRTGKKTLALLTLVFDGLKGAAAVLAAWFIAPWLGQIAGIAALMGHMFPVWIGFKGGKGVATAIGVLLAIYLPLGAAVCFTWLLVAFFVRYSSVAALAAMAFVPFYAWMLNKPDLLLLCAVTGILIWIRHHANIERLLAGTEPAIGQRTDGGNDVPTSA